MTAIFHEYFHPEDLDLVIPMVAPISFSVADPRYPEFLTQIGTRECREKLDEGLIGAFDRVPDMASYFSPDDPFLQAQYEDHIRYSLATFTWAYWQYLGHDYCSRVPDSAQAGASTLVDFYIYFAGAFGPRPIHSDEAARIAYVYQSFTELGSQDYFPTGFLDRLVSLEHISPVEKQGLIAATRSIEGVDVPWTTLPAFDTAPMRGVDAWLRSEAADVLAVYGEYDPWTGGMVTLNADRRSKVYVAPQRPHSTLLRDLRRADLTEVADRIWAQQTQGPVRRALRSRGSHTRVDRTQLNALLRAGLL